MGCLRGANAIEAYHKNVVLDCVRRTNDKESHHKKLVFAIARRTVGIDALTQHAVRPGLLDRRAEQRHDW